MITQREIDIWRVEAQIRIRELVEEWLRAYMGNRLQQPEGEQNADNRAAQPTPPAY